jgi:hypothetical protein
MTTTIESAATTLLRAAFITATLDAGVPLRDVQIAARHADPRTTRQPSTTGAARTSTAMPPTSSSPSPISAAMCLRRRDVGR